MVIDLNSKSISFNLASNRVFKFLFISLSQLLNGEPLDYVFNINS